MAGWVAIYRDLLEKPIWLKSSPEQKTILITLLLMVNHKENEWEWQGKPYKVAPGQVITSLKSIVEKCGKGVSTQNVRTALRRFEKYGFLTDVSTNQNRLITIINWGHYQSIPNQPISILTDSQQLTNKQITINNNEKKINNEKQIKKSPCRKSKIYDVNSVPFKLSNRLLNNIRRNNHGFKEPDLQKWSEDFRLMMERDKRTEEQISYLIGWSQRHSFWRKNILSPGKLRKQFDRLILEVQSDKEVKQKSPQMFSLDRPSHWEEPDTLSEEEKLKLREWEAEMPF